MTKYKGGDKIDKRHIDLFESISDIRVTLETMEVLIQSEEEEVKGGIVLYIEKEPNKTQLKILEYESDDINCLKIIKSLDELHDYISKHKLKIDDIITN